MPRIELCTVDLLTAHVSVDRWWYFNPGNPETTELTRLAAKIMLAAFAGQDHATDHCPYLRERDDQGNIVDAGPCRAGG